MKEAEKMKEIITQEAYVTADEFEEYLEPIEFAIEPNFEHMMMKAREQESRELRRTVAISSKSKQNQA